MMGRAAEFCIDGWATGESGRFTAIGRCGELPIRVNDRFDTVYRYRPRHFPDEIGEEPVRETEKPVSLRVECIHAYGRSLSELGEGMTGSLVLRGEGLQHVAPGWLLGTKSSSADGEPADSNQVGMLRQHTDTASQIV